MSGDDLVRLALVEGLDATPAAVIADGEVVPADPHAAIAAGSYREVPVLAGSTFEEGKLIGAYRPSDYDRFTLQYRFDPDRPESRIARLQVDDALQRGSGRGDPIAVKDDRVSEPGSRYVDFVVPGLLGMNLMGSGIWGLGFSIVDARRKKLLKRMIATPMSRIQFLASFVLSRLTMLIIEVGALVGFAVLVFGVPVRGSLLSLLAICLLSALAFGALGLLLASRTQTIEGASGLMNLVMLPMWIFSGVFFSSTRFPDALQPFIQALPLTAVNDALRASMLEGAGLARLAPELAIVAAWLVASFLLAVRLFRWR